MVIIAFVAQKNLHATVSQAGLAAGIYVIGTLVARLIMGKQIELIGRKQVLRYSAIFYLLTTISYLFTPTIGILFIVRFLNGLAYGCISTATNTIVTAYIPDNQKGKGINYYGLSTSLAAALGPFLGMLLLNLTTFNFIIWVTIILVLIVTICCFLFPVNNITLSDSQIKVLKSFSINGFIEKKALFISTIAFIMGISYSTVITFLSSYSKSLNLTVAGSFFFVVYALIVTITRPGMGQLFDSKGEKYVMYPSYLFLTIGLIILGFASNSFILLLSGAIIGFGYGTFMSNGQAISLKLATEDRIGISLSTYFIGLDLGLGVGPYIMGIIKSHISYQNLYLLASILPILCLLAYLSSTKRNG
jgi:MFS family permease